MSKFAHLPGILAEIADVAGEPAAVIIAARKGGRKIYIPARISQSHWLVDAIGPNLAKKICAHFAPNGCGQRFDVPLWRSGVYPQLRRAVAKRVHDLDKDGASASHIAAETGVTMRTIHRHRRAHRGGGKDDRQPKLF